MRVSGVSARMPVIYEEFVAAGSMRLDRPLRDDR